MERDIFKGVGIEVKLNSDDDFLKVRETLTRIGVASKKTNTLFQSVHIFHKQGRYVILHFKELFVFDGKPSNISENDIQRRNTIVKLLQDWGFLKIVDDGALKTQGVAPLHQIKIIPYKDVKNWNLVAKYNIGKK